MYMNDVLADYIETTTYESIPDEVVVRAKMCIIDSVACSYGATLTQTGETVVTTINICRKQEALLY